MSKSRRAEVPDDHALDEETASALLRFTFSDVFEAHVAPPPPANESAAEELPARPNGAPPRRQARIGHWYITRHAAFQFRDRFFPEIDGYEASARLAVLSETAQRVHGCSRRDGKQVHMHPDVPAVRFVVSDDAMYGRPTLVTVVDAPGQRGRNPDGVALRRRTR